MRRTLAHLGTLHEANATNETTERESTHHFWQGHLPHRCQHSWSNQGLLVACRAGHRLAIQGGCLSSTSQACVRRLWELPVFLYAFHMIRRFSFPLELLANPWRSASRNRSRPSSATPQHIHQCADRCLVLQPRDGANHVLDMRLRKPCRRTGSEFALYLRA